MPPPSNPSHISPTLTLIVSFSLLFYMHTHTRPSESICGSCVYCFRTNHLYKRLIPEEVNFPSPSDHLFPAVLCRWEHVRFPTSTFNLYVGIIIVRLLCIKPFLRAAVTQQTSGYLFTRIPCSSFSHRCRSCARHVCWGWAPPIHWFFFPFFYSAVEFL